PVTARSVSARRCGGARGPRSPKYPPAAVVPGKGHGRHRASNRSPRRRSPVPSVVPARRRAGIGLVVVATKLAHTVTPDELARGHYQALCGGRFQAASLVEPAVGPANRASNGRGHERPGGGDRSPLLVRRSVSPHWARLCPYLVEWRSRGGWLRPDDHRSTGH